MMITAVSTGCSSDKKKVSENEETKDNTTETTETTETSKSPEGTISDLRFEVPIPDEIKYKGDYQMSASWVDENGKNLVFITLTDEFPTANSDGDEFIDKEIYAYLYLMNNDSPEKVWEVKDFIRECPVDIRLDYIPRTLSITDLDENGIAEVAFMYVLSCKGDVSPDDVKLIMYEGKNKYAIRGTNIVSPPEFRSEYEGQTEIDPSFNKAPKVFLDHAKKMWERFRDL